MTLVSGPSTVINRVLRPGILYLALVVIPTIGSIVLVSDRRTNTTTATGAIKVEITSSTVSHLFITTAVVLTLMAGMRLLGSRSGLSTIVMELVAGILLGPSILGGLAPNLEESLFSPDVKSLINVLAQFGVTLFMFLVGLRTNSRDVVGRAIIVGHSAVAIPFLFAIIVMISFPNIFVGTSEGAASLAFGALAISITAFPVLARILEERGLDQSRPGKLALNAAGVGDVTAWCVLALVLAAARESGSAGVVTKVAALGLLVLVLCLARPLLPRLLNRLGTSGGGVAVLAALIGTAAATDRLGFHFVVGAFVAGIVMPRHHLVVTEVSQRINGAVEWLLLPMFFVYLGLNSSVSSVFTQRSGLVCLVAVLVIAVLGKVGSAALSCRLAGETNHDALLVGIAMNCRGLTELVVLQIGRAAGLIGSTVFAAMIVMTIVTTVMTDPLLAFQQRRREARTKAGVSLTR